MGNVQTFDQVRPNGTTPHENKFFDGRNAVLRPVRALCDM